MNKRVFIMFAFCLFLLLLVIIPLGLADEGGSFWGAGASGSWESPNIFGITPESGVQLTEKWDYLGKEWKTILLQNSVVLAINSFLQKINFIFVFLFGVNYSMSLALFLTVFLWICLFFLVFNLLGYTIFSKWVSLIIAFGIAIGAAQIKMFQMPVNLIIGLFFGEKPWWVKLLIGAGILIAIVIAVVLIKKFGKKFAEGKKKMEEEVNRIKLEIAAKTGERIYKSAGKKS